jgi:3-hydroxyacyl-CoA dehydrogenase
VAETVRKARARIDDQVHGAAPAPYLALELIAGAATWSLEEGYRAEEDALAGLLPSPQAQASIYAFDLVERRAKRGVGIPEAEPRRVQKVGIVGAGLMATQLATLFLRRLEVPIVLRDVDDEIVERARESIREDLAGLVAKGRYDEGKARFLGELVTGGTGYDAFAGCDLVLEAVFEQLDVKNEVFAEVEAVVGPECVLATNTSSLSVTEMGADLRHPERLVGMHFFNPVALMPLVELIRTPETDDATLATAWDVTGKLRKRGVLVRDAPGFVVNRVLTRMTRVLMDAIEHGTSVDETDEAIMRLGMPMAPSVLLAMVGPRVANHVLETMHDAYPDRFALSPALAALAAGDEPVVLEQAPRTTDSIREAALEAMADEIARLLEEGVVGSAADVDTCLLLGAGFPFFLGGITKHLDQTGVSERVVGRPLAEIRAAAPA